MTAARRRAYQDELREKLASQDHLAKAIDIAEKMDNPTLEYQDVQLLDKAFSARMRLVDKYLPALKSIELTGDPENPLEIAAYELTSTQRAARIAAILEQGATARTRHSTDGGNAELDESSGSTEYGGDE